MWIISLGFQSAQAATYPGRLVLLDVLGCLVWSFGFIFEAVADWQLSRFRSDHNSSGKVMDRGLWAYSRHPNYFGESMIWWGLSLIALTDLSRLWTVVSPLVITFLLLKVSGVTLLERDISKRRPEYQAYIRRTNAFIPWFPQKNKEQEKKE